MFENKDTIKILSIDGGGIRGIIPVTILSEIEKRTGKQIYELFDFIAGTSTGGLLTLFLNKNNPAPAAALSELYLKHGQDIFPPKPVRKTNLCTMLKDKLKNTLEDYLSGPKYSVGGINQILKFLVKNETYKETIKPCLITSYETENNKAVFFTNYTERYQNTLIRDIARATSAAPTYFEPVKIKDKGTFIDGGMHSNNPAMCAYIEVIKLLKKEGLDIKNKRIVMVSLGTGDCLDSYEYNEMKGWSALNWITGPLLPYFFGGNSSTVEYQLQQLLPEDCYYRFQVKLPKELDAMDNADPENVKALQHYALANIEKDWSKQLENLCNLLNTTENLVK